MDANKGGEETTGALIDVTTDCCPVPLEAGEPLKSELLRLPAASEGGDGDSSRPEPGDDMAAGGEARAAGEGSVPEDSAIVAEEPGAELATDASEEVPRRKGRNHH